MKYILFAITFILVSCTASISVKADPDIYVEPLAPNTLSPKKDKDLDLDTGEYLKNRIAPRNPTQQIMLIACDTKDYVDNQVLTEYNEKKLFGGVSVVIMIPNTGNNLSVANAQRFAPQVSLYVNQDKGTWSLISETGNYACLIANGAEFSPGE
jgi:hypothetical protein